MSSPAVASLGYLKSNCTDEELFLSFEKMISGSQFPSNVITDVNPFLYMPSNLPDGIWFFICSEEIKDNKVGFWKTKGNACEIFSNSVITGLRTTLEFYEGQAPHGCKTDWVMHKHRILQREPCEGSKAKEANFLCRVFLGGEQSQNHEMEQKLASSGIQSENYVHPAKSVAAESSIGQSSTSKPQVIEDDSTSRLALAERFPEPWLENLPEVDYLSGGDYMELLDLDNPASPSSSSENSSCVTMSSDGCFDALALLQDLECGDSQKDVDLKFAVSSSLRPEEGVMFPPTSGSLVTGGRNMLAPEEILNTDCFIPKSAACGQVIDNSFNRAIKNPKTNFGNEGPSSNSRNVTASLNSHIEAPDGENRAAVDRKKNFMKYLCFMAF
ncbi:NAC domain-containing protein 96-like isoform X2 [Juglans regia]|nr:NAC domain-containing protein 96-like isoform X2 [Juglans regia]XP_018821576.1 NAC domain-containing protein 96-like isoform X2 [Juglans regia]XP_018821577.1 NAC domain-containing protein 96-like isoform X2 [Juglans regia]